MPLLKFPGSHLSKATPNSVFSGSDHNELLKRGRSFVLAGEEILKALQIPHEIIVGCWMAWLPRDYQIIIDNM